jgi:hypothetical protein
VIDPRDAVLCSWIFDLDRGAPAPFGFTLVEVHEDRHAGHLAALLATRAADGGTEYRLVNRGTRVETGSAGALLGALRADMRANLAILRGDADAPILRAALRSVEVALARVPGEGASSARLLLLGQSLGGGLAQFQAIACHLRRPSLARFVTFAASDVARAAAMRFEIDAAALPSWLGENWVSVHDGLTGPRAPFGMPRIGTRYVVHGMRGRPPIWPALSHHRAHAWVSHCAGRAVDGPPLPHPASALDWNVFPALPGGWPAS